MALFADRCQAGQALADVLRDVLSTAPAGAGASPAVVLGLPRGGVPVAAEVAAALRLSLDVLVVRKLGTPGRPELALGAIGSGGAQYLDEALIGRLGISPDALRRVLAAETAELVRREATYRSGRGPLEVSGRTVVLVDDGLATGSSMRAAALAVRARFPARIVAAAPVGPRGVADRLADVVDDVVVAFQPAAFRAVGAHYADFSQTSDAQVRAALDAAAGAP